jgi:HlyD family secretion protein
MKLDDREYAIAVTEAENKLLDAQIEYGVQSAESSSPAEAGLGDTSKAIRALNVTKEEFEQATMAYREGKISSEEYDRIKRDYAVSQAIGTAHRRDVVANRTGLAQAEQAVARAKLNLSYTEMRAPFAGRVANFGNLVIGQQVQAGEKCFKLVDVSRLKVEVGVLESEVGVLVIGRNAEVRVAAYPEAVFSGTVTAISPIVDVEAKTCKVVVEMRNVGEKIKPGMYATVKLESAIYPSRLLAPKAALLVRDQRQLVFVAKEGLAKWCYIETGLQNENEVEILGGIEVGDSVIVSGHYTLSHDAKVRITMNQ